jgi:hypothetical protein
MAIGSALNRSRSFLLSRAGRPCGCIHGLFVQSCEHGKGRGSPARRARHVLDSRSFLTLAAETAPIVKLNLGVVMNRKQKNEAASMAWLAIAGIYIGSAVYEAVKTTVTERKKRSKIEAYRKAESERIAYAKKLVLARIDDGAYNKTGVTGVMDDFEFIKSVMTDIDEQ